MSKSPVIAIDHNMDIATSAGGSKISRKRKFTSQNKCCLSGNKGNRQVEILECGERSTKCVQVVKVFTLNSFSDEVLFEIFRHLDATALLCLEETCKRFYGLIQDHRFWNIIEITSKQLPLKTIQRCLKKAHFSTHTVKIRSIIENNHNIDMTMYSKTLLESFATNCSNLKVLELTGAYIDFRLIQILDFPKTLKRLVLDNCKVCMTEDIKSIFCGIDTHLVHLEELYIENNNWFDPFFVMAFSKIPELKFLGLKGCFGLTEFVPYGSMAARFGFKKLEHLDVRETPIKDSDIQCFNAVITLKELLLECPNNDHTIGNASANNVTFSRNLRMQGVSSSNSDTSSTSSSLSPLTSGNPTSNRRLISSRHQPDQIIYLDLHNRRRAIVVQQNQNMHHRTHSRGQINALDQLNEVLLHPMFWDLINPVERPLEAYLHNQDNYTQFPSNSLRPVCPSPISDRGICSFGRPPRPVEQGIIWVRVGNRPSDNRFERLSVRDYKFVTDISLQHLVQCSPNLVYLDLTGTSVTREGVQDFRNSKPHCQIIANHLSG